MNRLQILAPFAFFLGGYSGSSTYAQSDDLHRAQQSIKHVVVIFQENVSFDHYFGTYPHALNPPDEPRFDALRHTPKVDGYTEELLTQNPNFLNESNGPGRANPFRLKRNQAATVDQDHSYGPEQQAFHAGKMDLFPKSLGHPDGPRVAGEHTGTLATSGLTMGYFDGNTVTAYWNYAQHFAMSDRQFDVTFGPSTPGAINLASGQTNGAVNAHVAGGLRVSDHREATVSVRHNAAFGILIGMGHMPSRMLWTDQVSVAMAISHCLGWMPRRPTCRDVVVLDHASPC